MSDRPSTSKGEDRQRAVGYLDVAPLWRRGFDLVEGGIRPRLEEIIGAEQFAVAMGLLARLQRSAQRSSEQATRRLLHSVNLPAGSDVIRILAELGRLERQVSSLSRQLDNVRRGDGDGARTKPQRPARSVSS